MSSDSGESHASAHSARDGETGSTHGTIDSPVQLRDWEGPSTPAEDAAEEEEQQSLDERDIGTNGITFARRRTSQSGQDEESLGSELAIRPASQRRQSVESASTPDDTPSIQVGSPNLGRMYDNIVRALGSLRLGAVCQLRTARSTAHIGQRPCNHSRDDSPRACPLPRLALPELSPRQLSCLPGRVSRPYRAT
jgi:hypothetical protein